MFKLSNIIKFFAGWGVKQWLYTGGVIIAGIVVVSLYLSISNAYEDAAKYEATKTELDNLKDSNKATEKRLAAEAEQSKKDMEAARLARLKLEEDNKKLKARLKNANPANNCTLDAERLQIIREIDAASHTSASR